MVQPDQRDDKMIFDITLKSSSIVAGITQRTVRVCAADQASAESKLLSDPRYVEILAVVYAGGIK